jgi:hypothetical protein
MSNKTLSQVTSKPGDSHFLFRLMEVKDQFLQCGRFKVHDGTEISLWDDN